MTFNPAKFVKTAQQTWEDKLAFNQFMKANAHLALPFHVEGLEGIVPDQYPGELAIYAAKSHQGKSTALRDVTFKAQKRIEGKPNALVGLVSIEDTSEGTAGKQVKKYGGNSLAYQDDQFVFIGNSFGMSMEDMSQLNVGNIIETLEYGRSKKFADIMQYAHIGIDYAQIIPPDPERRKMNNNDQKRLQIADDVIRIFHACKKFKCPIGLASQALLKTQRDNYTQKMRIPGAADLAEAGELYSIPDIVYAYWQPKHDHPMNTMVEEGNWNFKVEPNLVFVRIVKRRNAEEMGYVGERDVVGRVFPCHIEPSGGFVYDKSYHDKIYLKPIRNVP